MEGGREMNKIKGREKKGRLGDKGRVQTPRGYDVMHLTRRRGVQKSCIRL